MPQITRTTTRESGLEITQKSDTELSWEYRSGPLGETLEGTLTHTTERGGGWIISGDTPGLVFLASVFVGPPQRLRDAITEVEDMIKRTEVEQAKPDPRDERRKRELDDLFGPIVELT
jgi:hypothetical protein